MKKGFTLIELLACIVILSIIIVIAVPRINDSLTKNKEKSFFTSSMSVLRAIEYSDAITKTNEVKLIKDLGIDISDNSYDLSASYVKIENEEITLNLKGAGSFDGLYLCGLKSSSKLDSNISVSKTACTDF